MEKVVIRLGNQYGNKVCLPGNEQATRLATIASTKTLTPATLLLWLGMGGKIAIDLGHGVVFDVENKEHFWKVCV